MRQGILPRAFPCRGHTLMTLGEEQESVGLLYDVTGGYFMLGSFCLTLYLLIDRIYSFNNQESCIL
jgi:hypothetical protein